MDTVKHTPTPYRVAETRHGFDIIIRNKQNDPIAAVLISGYTKAEGKANAEFIVRACNSHYDLLKALTLAIPIMNPLIPGAVDIINLAKTAIAKAEGK